MTALGERVRKLLALRADINQSDLAKSLGVSQQAIAKMTSPKKPQRSSKHITRLARFFCVSVELMEDNNWDPALKPPGAYLSMPWPPNAIGSNGFNHIESPQPDTAPTASTSGSKDMKATGLNKALDALFRRFPEEAIIDGVFARIEDSPTEALPASFQKRNRGT